MFLGCSQIKCNGVGSRFLFVARSRSCRAERAVCVLVPSPASGAQHNPLPSASLGALVLLWLVGRVCVPCAPPRFSSSDEPNQRTGGIAAHRSIIRPLPVLVFAPRAASLAGLPVCLDLPSSRKKTETTYIYYESQYVVDLALFSFFSFSSIKSVLFCFVLLCLVWFASK